MLTLYRINGVLFAKCRLNLKRGIEFNNQIYNESMFEEEHMIEVDAVIAILTENGCIKIFNGEKFVKFGLGEFSDLIIKKEYLVKNVDEKKVEKNNKMVENEPEKVEEDVPEQVEIEEESKELSNENKKKRHKNNN